MSVKRAGPAVVDPFGTYSSKKGDKRLFTDYLQTLSNLQRGPDPSVDSGFRDNVRLATTIKRNFGSSALAYLATKSMDNHP